MYVVWCLVVLYGVAVIIQCRTLNTSEHHTHGPARTNERVVDYKDMRRLRRNHYDDKPMNPTARERACYSKVGTSRAGAEGPNGISAHQNPPYRHAHRATEDGVASADDGHGRAEAAVHRVSRWSIPQSYLVHDLVRSSTVWYSTVCGKRYGTVYLRQVGIMILLNTNIIISSGSIIQRGDRPSHFLFASGGRRQQGALARRQQGTLRKDADTTSAQGGVLHLAATRCASAACRAILWKRNQAERVDPRRSRK